jgi:hypothetical protein
VLSGGLLLALALAVLVGVSLGTLGSGGSIITVPVLVYVAGVPPAQAVGMSLVIVGATAAVGALLHGGAGIDRRVAVIFAASGVAGAYAGAQLTPLVTGAVLMRTFALLMIAAGWRMLAATTPAESAALPCRVPRCAAVGLAVGVLTGFLGVGGGFLIVPALVLFAGLGMKRAVPTSLAVMAVNAIGGILGQLGHVRIDGRETAGFLVAALIGMAGGVAASRRIPADRLRRAFAWAIILLAAVILVWQAFGRAGRT